MEESTRLIDLYGHSVGTLHKDKYIMVLLFADDNHGKIVCTIPNECMLYRGFKRNARYHLKVELKGKSKIVPNGTSFTKNTLIVKSAKLI
ncbi:hypothetical protein [Paraliobacillus sediminis]|uniref:hypothetical protein n=1 Tax=Paraliobacillus sediminis TaxID=1885916 RepID=UPI000E3CFCF3|nr:hypothetical protein [Paraliobacillus sediminis]